MRVVETEAKGTIDLHMKENSVLRLLAYLVYDYLRLITCFNLLNLCFIFPPLAYMVFHHLRLINCFNLFNIRHVYEGNKAKWPIYNIVIVSIVTRPTPQPFSSAGSVVHKARLSLWRSKLWLRLEHVLRRLTFYVGCVRTGQLKFEKIASKKINKKNSRPYKLAMKKSMWNWSYSPFLIGPINNEISRTN